MRLGRVSDPTGQQKEMVARMVLARSGMQVGGRMGGVMVMKGVVWVSSAVWIGERQLEGRVGKVVLMKAAWGRSMI